jgi:hypothetical protein
MFELICSFSAVALLWVVFLGSKKLDDFHREKYRRNQR